MPEPAPDLTAAQSAVIDALITAFARREIDGHDDLHNRDSMPPELWRAIGAASLARIALPMAFGGTGGGFRVLAAAAETMAAEGGVMGVVTSWLARQLQSRMLFLYHGDAAQRATYLPDLAA
ncbi:MAG: acyl-CoA dehydrogenase family protein, partial [Proteobacteria bacterium]|nr:acyl-CoA dehydrogenase family protein [Pseudomonadota bacterium]